MIRLIGINHNAARYRIAKPETPFSPEQIVFKEAVESAIREYKPDLLAQEDNEAFLPEGWAFVLPAIGKYYGINPPSLDVDPCMTMRSKIRYKGESDLEKIWKSKANAPYDRVRIKAHEIAHQFPIRERYWLSNLKKTGASNILFVCGDIHIFTFSRLLQEELIDHELHARAIGVNSSNQYVYDALKLAQEQKMFDDTSCFCLE